MLGERKLPRVSAAWFNFTPSEQATAPAVHTPLAVRLPDEKQREACRKESYAHRGDDHTTIEFRRTVADGQRILWGIVDTVPLWRNRCRWSVD